MKQDPENAKDQGLPTSPLFALPRALIDRLYSNSSAATWGLPLDRFQAALERSSAKHFTSSLPSAHNLEEYLAALHLQDLALACACAEDYSEAWDHFVHHYRAYLRSVAAAILRCSSASPAARDLADSLFADLYGLSAGKNSGSVGATSAAKSSARSLFRYFHGRSSLKTWLRAVLAQRHIDAIRSSRRFTELEDDNTRHSAASHTNAAVVPINQSPPDPHRARYLTLLSAAFESALAALDSRDRDRLRLYYSGQQTLAEIGRALGEHESSVSRNLDRIRRELRGDVEATLRKGRPAVNGLSPQPGLSDQEIALCFQYASEDAPIDFDKLFPQPSDAPNPKPSRQP
jgi:RNA polymerase sigma factor (sigma-70 family)